MKTLEQVIAMAVNDDRISPRELSDLTEELAELRVLAETQEPFHATPAQRRAVQEDINAWLSRAVDAMPIVSKGVSEDIDGLLDRVAALEKVASAHGEDLAELSQRVVDIVETGFDSGPGPEQVYDLREETAALLRESFRDRKEGETRGLYINFDRPADLAHAEIDRLSAEFKAKMRAEGSESAASSIPSGVTVADEILDRIRRLQHETTLIEGYFQNLRKLL